MHEQSDQDDDGQGHAQQEKQNRTHFFLLERCVKSKVALAATKRCHQACHEGTQQ